MANFRLLRIDRVTKRRSQKKKGGDGCEEGVHLLGLSAAAALYIWVTFYLCTEENDMVCKPSTLIKIAQKPWRVSYRGANTRLSVAAGDPSVPGRHRFKRFCSNWIILRAWQNHLPPIISDDHLGPEELVGLFPTPLGAIHCNVGMHDQALRIRSIVWIDAHTNTRCNVDRALMDEMDLCDISQQSFHRGRGFLRVLQSLEHHDKFVASESAHRVRGAQAVHKPLCDGLQNLISEMVPPRVVDMLETVQIEKQDRSLALLPMSKSDRLAHPVSQ